MDFFANHTNLLLAVIALISGTMLVWPLLTGQSAGISALVATQLINYRKAIILDVRNAEEFSSGHLPKAKQINVSDIDKKIKQFVKRKDNPIIVVCDYGQSSSKASARLKKLGYTEVFSLKGGINAWKQSDMPIIQS